MLYRSQKRSGVVLLVVMALLSLFATVGLSFVFYADAEAVSAKFSSDALVTQHPEVNSEALSDYFFNQFLYDTPNEYSAMRGWSLSRSIYGHNPTQLNFTPYNGVGREALTGPPYPFSPLVGAPVGVNNFNLINYQKYVILPWNNLKQYVIGNTVQNGGATYVCIKTNGPLVNGTQAPPVAAYWTAIANDPLASLMRSPEYYGDSSMGANHRYVGGANPPHTSYDTNSIFLAQVRADGTVLMPSFYRPWTANVGSNTAAMRYMSLSPDPLWNSIPDAFNPNISDPTKSFYPLPDADPDGICHVRNLDFGPGRLMANGAMGVNDSRWIDVGYPIITAPNGKRYKVLFAPLVMDLSNRLHLLAHGNRNGDTPIAISGAPAGATVAGTTVTIQTTAAHGYAAGQVVVVAGVTNPAYNGTFTIVNVFPGVNRFTYTLPSTVVPPTGPSGGGIAMGTVHASNMGIGAPEVDLFLRTPGVSAPIAVDGASHALAPAPARVTIRTLSPHGFVAGQKVTIFGVRNASYNRTVTINTIGAAPATTFTFLAGAPLLPISGSGMVVDSTQYAEMQALFDLKYGAASMPASTLVGLPNNRGGTWYSQLDFDARRPLKPTLTSTDTPGGSRPLHLAFSTFTDSGAPGNIIAGPNRTVKVGLTYGPHANGFHYSIYPGMLLTIRDPAVVGPPAIPLRTETVTVKSVNYADHTFVADFMNPHTPNKQILFVLPTQVSPKHPFGWDNYVGGAPGETVNNPLSYNPFLPVGTNRVPATSLMEAILRHNGTNAPAATSEIFRRMPNTFLDIRKRNMYTTLNNKLDRIGGSPVLAFDRTLPDNYKFDPALGYPKYAVLPPMTPPYATPGALPNSDFTDEPGNFLPIPSRGGWRSNLGQMLRVDLNRSLTDYPIPTAATGLIPNGLAYNAAVNDRQNLARDIYMALVRVTGARDPNDPAVSAAGGMIAPIKPATPVPAGADVMGTTVTIQTVAAHNFKPGQKVIISGVPVPGYNGNFDVTPLGPNAFTYSVSPTIAATLTPSGGGIATSLDYAAARWLGQLAANIVDYVDADDYSTAFQWWWTNVPAIAIPDQWVFGTEKPRLVLNEVYAQHETGPLSRMNVWAELHNPFQTMAAGTYPWDPLDDNSAVLQLTTTVGNRPPYRIDIHAYTTNTDAKAAMSDPANNTGTLVTTPLNNNAGLGQNDWGTTATSRLVRPTFQPSGAPATPVPNVVAKPIQPDNANPAMAGASKMGATVTIRATGHGFNVGDVVTITGVTDSVGGPIAGYEGTFEILPAGFTANSFRYTAVAGTGALPTGGGGNVIGVQNANRGYYVIGPEGTRYSGAGRNPKLPVTCISPHMAMAPPSTIAPVATPGATATGNRVTITTAAPHNFVVNQKVVVSNVANPAFNGGGPHTILAATSTTFEYIVGAAQATAINNASSGNGDVTPERVMVLLRRLANPHRNHSTTLGINYNPYVTVDYLENVPVNQGVAASTTGRKQPYASDDASQIFAQAGSTFAGQPNNSFFSSNNLGGTPLPPFDWLVHLDRPLVNPLEILHVSGHKPHLLTQKFKDATGTCKHYAPWNPYTTTGMDPTTGIYRALEIFGTANHMAGSFNGGRHAGPVNLNTMMEWEVLAGVVGAQEHNQPNPIFRTFPNPTLLSNRYVYNPTLPNDSDALFNKVVTSRNNNVAVLVPTGEGKPFQPLSAGSLDKTIFRIDPTAAQPLFGIGDPADHPYHQSALMQKIYNNVTTTSNCYAVWVTTGYFEVVDETVKPAKLGQEIGRDLNRHIRHRFFAIVDRSGMELCRATSANNVTVIATNALPQNKTMNYTAASVSVMGRTTTAWNNTKSYEVGDTVSGTTGGVYFCIQPNGPNLPVGFKDPIVPANAAFWQPIIQPGMLVEVGSGAASEVVVVKTVTNNTFTANFMQNHLANSPIVVRGNPGPQPVYSPRRDPNVVLHLSVIQ